MKRIPWMAIPLLANQDLTPMVATAKYLACNKVLAEK